MMSQISFQQFSRSELTNDQELLKKLAFISRKEEQESDYPIPVPEIEFYKARLSIPDFPFDSYTYILVKHEDEPVGFGLVRSNSKINSELSSLYIYLLPDYRGKKISKKVIEQLLPSIPDRTKRLHFPMRADQNGLNFNYRKSLINYVTTNIGQCKMKSRRSTADLTEFNIEEVCKKAEELQNKAKEKGFDFVFVENRPDFEKIGFSEEEFIALIETINNDMPKENSSFEDVSYSKEMLDYRYKILEPLKRTRWDYIAIHNQTKKLIGITNIFFVKNNPVIIQDDTGVLQEYRGKRLGLTLKYLMLAKILTTNVTKNAKYWTTFNALSNSHMININNVLKYKEDGLWYHFEIDKEKLANLVKQEH